MTQSKSASLTDILLSAAVVPVLGGIILGDRAAELLIELGRASEEIWRGDRLPLIQRDLPQ